MGGILPPAHWLFQCANACLLLSYINVNMLYLRLILAAASLFFVLWLWLILDVALDGVLWNSLFLVINLVQAGRIIYEQRPVKFKSELHEQVYQAYFATIGMSRQAFKPFVELAAVTTQKAGTMYLQEGNTIAHLSLLIEGDVNVLQGEGVLNSIYTGEWLESPEFMRIYLTRTERKKKHAHTTRRGASVSHTHTRTQSSQAVELDRLDSVSETDGKHVPLHFGADVEYGGISDTATHPCRDPFTAAQGKVAREMSVNKQLSRAGSASPSDEDDWGDDATTSDVTFKCNTRTSMLVWNLEVLSAYLASDPGLQTIVLAVVGADVSKRLFRQGRINNVDLSRHMLKNRYSPDSASRKAEMKDEVTLLYKLTAFEERNTILAMRKPEPARQHVHCVNVDYLSDIQERVWELLSLGKWRYLRTRDCPFVAAGEDMTSLSVIMQGSVDVTNQTHPDQVLFTIGRMQWVGSMEFFATAGDSASSDSASSDCDAEAVERKSDADASTPPASELSSAFTYTVSETSTMPVRMLRFDQRDLRSYLLLHPSIALAFTSLIQQVTTRQFKQHLTRD